jgi:hypothetical protein
MTSLRHPPRLVWLVVAGLACAAVVLSAQEQIGKQLLGFTSPFTPPPVTEILGRPTHSSIVLNVRSDSAIEAYVEFGRTPGRYERSTSPVTVAAGQAVEVLMDGLVADTRYYYRLQRRPAGTGPYTAGLEHRFMTQRSPGSTFTFALQGDSHPERAGNMFNSDLYVRTLRAVAADGPDFYITSGDDFSVDTLRTVNQGTVTERYTLQVPYLSIVGQSSPLFLVNGNHEQAARYLLDGSPNNVAVWAQNARNRYFPQPAPDGFYSGNTEVVPHIGLLRNYYAWEWGDALFVVIDPYWSSPVAVDTVFGQAGDAGNNGRTTNKWDITHGDDQYFWLKRTLEQSRAKWKFVFAHHVMGGGRGAVELVDDYEWGGRNRNGSPGFPQNRPTWPAPIHQLMVANGVTIFFQAHDHLFVRQERDGLIYQELPNPADNTYTAFNADAYTSGDKFPNSGYVKVSVSPQQVKVDYVREYLPRDEAAPDRLSGTVQFSYTVAPRP